MDVRKRAKSVNSTPHRSDPSSRRQSSNALLVCSDERLRIADVREREALTELLNAVESSKPLADADQCVRFINTVRSEKVDVLILAAQPQDFIPRVHDMPKVESIFIVSVGGDRIAHERQAKQWRKVRGVFISILSVREALQKPTDRREPRSAVNSRPASEVTTNRLHSSFMYTQLLLEILSTIRFKKEHVLQFSNYCRRTLANNAENALSVDFFERNYYYRPPMWWYTRNPYLRRMLNSALEKMDVDVILRMGFFINDLHRNIVQLHKEQFSNSSSADTFTVYRQDRLSANGMDGFIRNKNRLMSFDYFLSTSKTRPALSSLPTLLFVMKIDPSRSTTPFASTAELDATGERHAVLFSTHSVFRIDDVKPVGSDGRCLEVHLSLTNDDDKELRALTDRLRQESFPGQDGRFRLGSWLVKMGRYQKAEETLRGLLEQVTDEGQQANIGNQLGVIRSNQGRHQEAMVFHEKALLTFQQTRPPTHPDLAVAYNNLGKVFHSMGDHRKALVTYEKAEIIQQRSHAPTTALLASTYNNFGAAYAALNEQTKAAECYDKALAIQRATLPTIHPDWVDTYSNIGAIHERRNDFSEACSCYERAAQIAQRSLPLNHPRLEQVMQRLAEARGKRSSPSSAPSSAAIQMPVRTRVSEV